ncbi:AraC family transcriptional regulator [Spirillospora sp. NPDC029432]|uniref:AraC family transcriptional regulator n=1 Tax=Spirillospora sp. NPDC029432 TaxID=3154599 RepID=UPI003454F095
MPARWYRYSGPMSETAPAYREVVPRAPDATFTWRTHGYPDPLARWNLHPEVEIHLIRRGTGHYVIGDAVGGFTAPALFVVGARVPHDWLSDLERGERIDDRDVVLQFDPERVARLAAAAPELDPVNGLLARSARGIEFSGATLERAGELLLGIGEQDGGAAIAGFLHLLAVLAGAPEDEWRAVASRPADGAAVPASDTFAEAVDYIFRNLRSGPRLSEAARIAGMSVSAFSRHFARASGQNFSDMVRHLRLAHACRLLADPKRSIASIAHDAGYANLSNFNRRFREEYAMTPRAYRRLLADENHRPAEPRAQAGPAVRDPLPVPRSQAGGDEDHEEQEDEQ